MKIAENCVVSIHYRLTDDEGEELDSSASGDPLIYLHGGDNIIPGLEGALEGHVQMVTVQEVKGQEVTIDANHPLAGQVLHFSITVEAVRAATAEEIDHGHVHDGHGHHH